MTGTRVEAMSEAAWEHAEAGRAEEAARLFREILQLDPGNAEAWMMTGMLQAESGNADQAVASLTRAIEIDPDYADAYLQLARIRLTAGDAGAALDYARRAVRCDNDYAEAWMLTAELCARTGDAAATEMAYRQVLRLEPGRADVHNRLAAVLSARGCFAEALEECRRALALEPDNPEIHANLGNVYYQQGVLPGAIMAFERALQIRPDFMGARLNLGNAFRALRDYRKAAECYQQLLHANPGFMDAQLSLGECCLHTGELQRAIACYDAVLATVPDMRVAQLNKGFVLSLLGRNAEALEYFNKVLAADPRNTDAWFNRGLTEKRLGQFDAAQDSLRRALSFTPGNLDIQLSLSLIELLRGDFRDGWRHYGARKSVRDRAPVDPAALRGDLGGRRLLLVKDQGLGDEIFFLRFARRLKEHGAWLAYQTDPKIKSLVERIDFLDAVAAESDTPPQVDLILSVGDLPYLLEVTDVPPPVGIPVSAAARAQARALLAQAGSGPRVGVTWWAGTRQPRTAPGDRLAYREVPLRLLAETLRPTDAAVVVLQRNPLADELEEFSRTLGRDVLDLSSLNDDLEAMLALLMELDDYVGVDNTNMHLSASLDKPCRILVPHPPEWRMMTEGNVSPWFPGFALYRQDASGDWSDALARLRQDLQQCPGQQR